MIVITNISNTTYTVSEMDSFKRMVETPLGSRVIRPTFGSKLYSLIDMNMDDEFNMLLTSYLLDCFYDDNDEPWDNRWQPNSVNLVSLDATTGEVGVVINFENDAVGLNIGGF